MIDKDVKSIMDFLGEKNVEKIRDAMTEALIDNLEESIREDWIVAPDVIEKMWKEITEETVKKYEDRIKDAMCKEIEKMLENRYSITKGK